MNSKPIGKPAPRILRLGVILSDAKTDKDEGFFIVNFADPDKQAWLTRYVIWAANNRKTVEIVHIEDMDADELANLKTRFIPNRETRKEVA